MPTIRCSEEPLERFRAAVFEKHGKLRGCLKQEATQALRLHTDRLTEEARSDG